MRVGHDIHNIWSKNDTYLSCGSIALVACSWGTKGRPKTYGSALGFISSFVFAWAIEGGWKGSGSCTLKCAPASIPPGSFELTDEADKMLLEVKDPEISEEQGEGNVS